MRKRQEFQKRPYPAGLLQTPRPRPTTRRRPRHRSRCRPAQLASRTLPGQRGKAQPQLAGIPQPRSSDPPVATSQRETPPRAELATSRLPTLPGPPRPPAEMPRTRSDCESRAAEKEPTHQKRRPFLEPERARPRKIIFPTVTPSTCQRLVADAPKVEPGAGQRRRTGARSQRCRSCSRADQIRRSGRRRVRARTFA